MITKPLYSVSIGDAFQILKTVADSTITNKKVPKNVFLHGSMGLGKSTIIKDLANYIRDTYDEFDDVVTIDLRLSGMEDGSSVQGIPHLSQKVGDEQDMMFSTPQWWPKNENAFYILFLDELTNAHPTIQQAAYRLVLDRSIQNGKALSNNVMIVGAGNMKSDKTGARELLPALANRFNIHLQIDKDLCVNSFIQYAFNHKLNPSIIAFINYKKDALNLGYNSEPAFPTSRSWEMLHENLEIFKDASTDILEKVIAGTIGSATAIEFMAMMECAKLLPNWSKVREGETYTVPTGRSEIFYIITALSSELATALSEADKEYVDALSNIVAQLPTDLKVVLFKTLKNISISSLIKVLSYNTMKTEYEAVSKFVR
ncbi:hypothetical protein [Alishewanella phage vB_AspM_Slicko01]|nr:hypothetical protein [Alishewanella phage vB_AspM_Slicko01]